MARLRFSPSRNYNSYEDGWTLRQQNELHCGLVPSAHL